MDPIVLQNLEKAIRLRADYDSEQKQNLIELLPYWSDEGLIHLCQIFDVPPPKIKPQPQPKKRNPTENLEFGTYSDYPGFSTQLIRDITDFKKHEAKAKNTPAQVAPPPAKSEEPDLTDLVKRELISVAKDSEAAARQPAGLADDLSQKISHPLLQREISPHELEVTLEKLRLKTEAGLPISPEEAKLVTELLRQKVQK